MNNVTTHHRRGFPVAPLLLLVIAVGVAACGRTTLGIGEENAGGGVGGDGGIGGDGSEGGSGGFVKGGKGGGGGKSGVGGKGGGGAVGGQGGGVGARGGLGGNDLGGRGGGPVSRLVIEPGFVTITAGQSTQLRATVQQAGITRDVTNDVDWIIGMPGIASTSPKAPGRVTGVSAGQTEVKVGFMGLSAIGDVRVVADTLLSLSLRPSETTVNAGGVVQLTALGLFASGQQRDLTADVAWMSSARDVAASNHLGVPGLVVAAAPGAATIEAKTEDGIRATMMLTVLGDARLSVVLEPNNGARRPGETFAFRATGIFADGTQRNLTNSAVWISSNVLVATVERGQARCLGSGEVTIVASFDGFSSQGTLSCQDVTILLLRLTPAETEVPKGTRLQYTATAFFSDGTNRIVTDATRFTVRDTAVGTVTTRGQATAVMAGTTIVEGLFEGVTGQATLTVL